jgi:lysophospholipase L1-like esterase
MSGIAVLLLAQLATGPAGAAADTDAGQRASRWVEVVAVGDSVTDADSPSFETGGIGAGSWAWTVDQGLVDVRGGWAEWGATTAAMRVGVRDLAVEPAASDVLVLMAGTNDVRAGMPWRDSARNLEQIVATIGAERVVVCTVVPLDEDPAGAERFNSRLVELAEDEGWEVVDSAAAVRNADGGWVPGTSDDGLHPNRLGAQLLGSVVRYALVG